MFTVNYCNFIPEGEIPASCPTAIETKNLSRLFLILTTQWEECLPTKTSSLFGHLTYQDIQMRCNY